MQITTAIRRASEALVGDLSDIFGEVVRFIPGLIVALLALAGAWIAGKILERLAFLLLRAVKFDELLAGRPIRSEELRKSGATLPPSRIAAVLVFWSVFFWFGIAPAARALRLAPAEILIDRVIGFVPEVLAALAVAAAAVFIAGLIRETLISVLASAGLPNARILGWSAWSALGIFGAGLALAVLGVAGSVIIAGLGIIAVSLGLALAIGFGIGARDMLGSLAAGRELKDRLVEGDEVTIEGHTGTVERLGLDTVDLRTASGLVSIPNNLFIQKAVIKKIGAEKRAA